MNFVTAIVLLVFLLYMLIGYKNGLFKSAMRMTITILAILVAYLAHPYISSFIIDSTNIDDYFAMRIETSLKDKEKERIEKELEEDGVINESTDEDVVDSYVAEEFAKEPTKSEQVGIIEELKVPMFLKEALIENNNNEMQKKLKTDGFYKYIAKYSSYIIASVLSFIILYILVQCTLSLLSVIIGAVLELPIINMVNRMGGLVLGFIEAILITWVLFLLMSIFVNTEFVQMVVKQIEDSVFLSYLYSNNMLLNVIIDMSKLL